MSWCCEVCGDRKDPCKCERDEEELKRIPGLESQLSEARKRIEELEKAGTPYWKERDLMNAYVLQCAHQAEVIGVLRKGLEKYCNMPVVGLDNITRYPLQEALSEAFRLERSGDGE